MNRLEYLTRAIELAPRGEALPHAKLTRDQVKAIRAAHVPYSRTHGAPALAKQHGLHRRTVEKVLSYQSWRHA